MKSSQYIEEKLDIRPHRCLLVKFMEYSAKESLHYPNSDSSFEWSKWYLKDFGFTLTKVLGVLIDDSVSDKNFRPIDEILIRSHAQSLMSSWLKKHNLKDDVVEELHWI